MVAADYPAVCKRSPEMLIVAFLCFLALVVAWIVAATPSVAAESTASAYLTTAPSAGD